MAWRAASPAGTAAALDFGMATEDASANEVWRVIVASGEHAMTLEALDEAFEAGHVDASTMVCAPGSYEFVRLGEIAGLDPDDTVRSDLPADVVFERAPQIVVVERAPESAAGAMSVDVDFTVDAAAFRPSWSNRRRMAVPAVLGMIALLIVGVQVVSSSSDASSSAAGSVARVEVAAPPPVVAPPVVAPVAAPPPVPAAPVLTAPQKKALAAKDKKAEAARNAKNARSVKRAGRSSAKKSASPFTKGGNAHDPLNGSL
jgi:hypothetical protein